MGSYYCRGLKWEQGAEPPSPLTLTTAHSLTRGFSVRASAEFLLLHADYRPVFDVCIYKAELAEGVFVRRLQSHRQSNASSVLPKPGAA